MLRDLREFVSERPFVELAAAIAIGFGSWEFVQALVQGLVIAPIESRAQDEFGRGPMTFRIRDTTFYYSPLVSYGLAFLIYGTLLALVVRRLRSRLWDPSALRECPHCLEEMPERARVCGSCGRDAPPQAATHAAVDAE